MHTCFIQNNAKLLFKVKDTLISIMSLNYSRRVKIIWKLYHIASICFSENFKILLQITTKIKIYFSEIR